VSWRLGISSGACTERPILQVLPAIVASGAAGIEIGTPPRHFDPWSDEQVRVLAGALAATPLETVSIHAPFGGLLDLAEPNPHHRHAAVGAVLTAAGALKRLGGRLVIVHPSDLERHGHDVGARLTDCANSLTLLADALRADGLALVVESPLPHLIGGHPDEFAWLLGRLDASVGVCLDTGHTALGRHWPRFVDVAGRRLVHVHANDNRGRWDDHLPPGDGDIDWPAVAHSLRACGYDGWIMLELGCPPDDVGAYLARARARAATLFGDP